MSKVLSGTDEATAYLDDVTVHTKSPDFHDHLAALRKVFERMRLFNLRLNPKKCVLVRWSHTFLGHVVTQEGYKPTPDYLKAIREYPVPTDVRKVRRFVGMANFQRSFIQDFAKTAEPLTSLTKKNVKFVWGPRQDNAFNTLKAALLKSPVLCFPDYDLPFYLFVDGSTTAVGAVLTQMVPDSKGQYRIIGYFSKSLSASERKWDPFKIELAAIVYAIRNFRHHVFMSPIIVFSDHRPISYLHEKAPLLPQIARWMMELQEYHLKIVYIPGEKNCMADALSRMHEDSDPASDCETIDDKFEFPYCFSLIHSEDSPARPKLVNDDSPALTLRTPTGIPYALNMRQEQQKDPLLNNIMKELAACNDPTVLEDSAYALDQGGCLRLQHPMSDRQRRLTSLPLIVPVHLRKLVFEYFHSSPFGGHMGWIKTLHKCERRYYWPTMTSEIIRWVQACESCQKRRNPTPKRKIPLVLQPQNTVYAKVAVDICGPLNCTSRGSKFILNAICPFSKFIVSVPLPDTQSLTVAHALLEQVFLRFGGCTTLVSDNAKYFSSEFYTSFCNMLSINQYFATPYWHQGTGVVERTFHTYHNMLSKYIDESGVEFDVFLGFLCMAHNTSVHSTTGESPWYLMYGRQPIFSVDQLLDPSVRLSYSESDADIYKRQLVRALQVAWGTAYENSLKAQSQYKKYYDRGTKDSKIEVGDRVYLHREKGKKGLPRKWNLPWAGQYRVLSIDSPHVVIVSCLAPQTSPKKVHLGQIKKAYELTGPACTLPDLPQEEVVALVKAEAENVDGLPGYCHPERTQRSRPTDTIEPSDPGPHVTERPASAPAEQGLPTSQSQRVPLFTSYNLRPRRKVLYRY